MNKEIAAAVHASTLPPPDREGIDTDFEQLIAGPHTLASIGAALATCPHPERCVVEGKATLRRALAITFVDGNDAGEAQDIAWCAACGAMCLTTATAGALAAWERPALVGQLTASHFNDLEGVGALLAAVQSAVSSIEEEQETLQRALGSLASLSLYREMKRVAHARSVLALREAVSL